MQVIKLRESNIGKTVNLKGHENSKTIGLILANKMSFRLKEDIDLGQSVPDYTVSDIVAATDLDVDIAYEE